MRHVLEYITDGLILDGEHVWHRSVLCALQSYVASMQRPDHERLQSCTQGLIRAWADLPRFELATPGWSWKPQDGVALASVLRDGIDLRAVTVTEIESGPTVQESLLRYLAAVPVAGLDRDAFHNIAHKAVQPGCDARNHR